MIDKADLENRFTYHSPGPEQVEAYKTLRSNAASMANLINEYCPDSREKSLAITSLEESVMWANASIARNT